MMKLVLIGTLVAITSARLVELDSYINGWAKTTQYVPSDHELELTVVVQEQGHAEIFKIAQAVSDPDNKSMYGRYLSKFQIDEITRPTAEDLSVVTKWLDAARIDYTRTGVSNLVVRTTVADAAELFNTTFHVAQNSGTSQRLVRASEYTVPKAVEGSIQTIFGLHGLPLPPKDALESSSPVNNPASVTPQVIKSTYDIKGVTIADTDANKQAVAEFQGQFMNSTDLATLFKNYVSHYDRGVDDVVYKWIGEHKEESGGIEAELDIQYMMSTSVGVKTVFYEFPGDDFGADLNKWSTSALMPDSPLVHSISYGWQGNLSEIHVKGSDIATVDANFAKLAAAGVSVIISSGDSGSGYKPDDSHCETYPGTQGVGIDGTALSQIHVEGVGQCCEVASETEAKGWTFVAGARPDTTVTTTRRLANLGSNFIFKDSVFHDFEVGKGVFAERDVFTLNGKLSNEGGDINCVNANGTYQANKITFGPPGKPSHKGSVEISRNVTATFGGKFRTGRAIFIAFPDQPVLCSHIEWRNPDKEGGESVWERGPNPPPPPPPGKCTLYLNVNAHTTANASTRSGFAATEKVVLWPSWPASSPWVTAVGATRFIGQKIGNDEMASDQFGSGGGFSRQFDQTNAQWQAAATAKYLSTVDDSTLPPAAAYPAKGRGTPDVSALGEGYQVIVGGHPQSIGGTSASSPAFAGMISIINDARLQAGKPQLGFLNPFLYKNEAAFTDITVGSNRIGRGGEPLLYGWNCSAGWDPATGLGTPVFSKLLAAAMAVGPDGGN